MEHTKLCIDVLLLRETPGYYVVTTPDSRKVYPVEENTPPREGPEDYKDSDGYHPPIKLAKKRCSFEPDPDMGAGFGYIELDEWYATQRGIWSR